MLGVVAHTASTDPAHVLLDASVSVGLGVVLVLLYLFVLRRYAGREG